MSKAIVTTLACPTPFYPFSRKGEIAPIINDDLWNSLFSQTATERMNDSGEAQRSPLFPDCPLGQLFEQSGNNSDHKNIRLRSAFLFV